MASTHVYVAPTRGGKAAAASSASMRIAFIHPDLGIGGAERLIVDAAVGLQKRGHRVEVFTSHHEDGPGARSFEETTDGTLNVHVLGNSIIPPSIFGKFSIFCAIFRQLHLALSLLFAISLYNLVHTPLFGFIPSFFTIPSTITTNGSKDWSVRRECEGFDVIIVDQLSACIPLLRWLGGNRVVFYCHFPDLLLSPARTSRQSGLGGMLREAYRVPIDAFEEATTGEADKLLANSEFTAGVFQETFPELRRRPRVIYPGIEVGAETAKAEEADRWVVKDAAPTLLSINRFEPKKDVALAIEAFALARVEHPDLRLVLAGGFDPRLASNVATLTLLQELAADSSLSFYTYSPSSFAQKEALPLSSPLVSSHPPPTKTPPQILFLLNITQSQKTLLLNDAKTLCLLYTPSNEHFGIVPLEGMLAKLPIVASKSGGPLETIVDEGLDSPATTGFLVVPSPKTWATALVDLLLAPEARRREMGEKGRARVIEKFSAEQMSIEFEKACLDVRGIRTSILGEQGALKLMAFIAIGSFCFSCGFAAFMAGPVVLE